MFLFIRKLQPKLNCIYWDEDINEIFMNNIYCKVLLKTRVVNGCSFILHDQYSEIAKMIGDMEGIRQMST